VPARKDGPGDEHGRNEQPANQPTRALPIASRWLGRVESCLVRSATRGVRCGMCLDSGQAPRQGQPLSRWGRTQSPAAARRTRLNGHSAAGADLHRLEAIRSIAEDFVSSLLGRHRLRRQAIARARPRQAGHRLAHPGSSLDIPERNVHTADGVDALAATARARVRATVRKNELTGLRRCTSSPTRTRHASGLRPATAARARFRRAPSSLPECPSLRPTR